LVIRSFLHKQVHIFDNAQEVFREHTSFYSKISSGYP